MPTARLRCDLQPDSWSSDDPTRGSGLQARDQQHKMSHSQDQTEALWTAESRHFILTLNQKYWRAAIRLSRLIFCLLFEMQSLFWQNRAHYCSMILVQKTQQNEKIIQLKVYISYAYIAL